MVRVGLISDTHGLLRPEAEAFLQGCACIVHGGDVGDPAILEALARIAPVTAVRGNNDHGAWASALREVEQLQVEEVTILVVHDLAGWVNEPGVRVVVSGHSHRPSVEERGGVLYVNPGSAGPRRFKLPIAMGELVISGVQVVVRTMRLEGSPGQCSSSQAGPAPARLAGQWHPTNMLSTLPNTRPALPERNP